jgi:hypothetical protein
MYVFCQVNRLKNKYRREGVEHPDDVVDLLAKELNISKAKATGVGVRLSHRMSTHVKTTI